MTMLQPGTQLDGRYEVLRQLGQGGMATVYQVRHIGLQSLHALKVLNPELAQNEDVKARFLSEGRIQARLRHPNIVQVTEIVTDPVPGLVMDYIEGPSLADEIRAHGAIGNVARVVEMFGAVLDAVDEAHRNQIVHRDLKPANIILGQDSRGRPQPKVTDFGIAKVLGDDARATLTGVHMGTLLYMSPEQIRAVRDVDARSDIFALGAILYEVVTGKIAFDAPSGFDTMRAIVDGKFEPPERVVGGLPPMIGGCIRKALAVDPKERFQSCLEFRTALEGALSPAAVPPPRPSASYAVTQVRTGDAGATSPKLGAVPPPPPPRNSPPQEIIDAIPVPNSPSQRVAPPPPPPPPVAGYSTPYIMPPFAPPDKDLLKRYLPPKRSASPVASFFLSFIPGLGQVVNGQVGKGLFLMCVIVVLGAVPYVGLLCPFAVFLLAIDAAMIASKRKRGRFVGRWEWF